MFNKYYQQELTYLKELSVEFSKKHPALAPYLLGTSVDPDIERLLEGVAFMTGLLRKKIDDELPEVIHGLMDVIFPHYLRPVPASTIMQFTPASGMSSSVKVKSGTPVASISVNSQNCIFNTCFDVHAEPMSIESSEYHYKPGEKATISIKLKLEGKSVSQINSNSLVFYIAGNYNKASRILKTIMAETGRIIVSSGEFQHQVRADEISIPGLERQNNLLPYPLRSFSGYMFIQEYFILPQKFLFFKIDGFDNWKNRGNGKSFEINFELKEHDNELPKISNDTFKLFCSPAINLFEVDGEPITLDHKKTTYKVIPPTESEGTYKVHSVFSVDSFVQKTGEHKCYYPFEMFRHDESGDGIFKENRSLSPITDDIQISLSIMLNNKDEPVKETLTPKLLCTNGRLADQLQVGDIHKHLTKSPSMLDFNNITSISTSLDPPLHKETLWKFLSHISINLLSVADAHTVKELLELYIYSPEAGSSTTAANLKRIDGVTSVKVEHEDRLLRGLLTRGSSVIMKAKSQNFAGIGDLYLFGCVMDKFFSAYCSINAFVRFSLKDDFSGELFEWKSRKGERPQV